MGLFSSDTTHRLVSTPRRILVSVTAVGSNLTALRPNIVNGWKEAAPKPADFVALKKKTIDYRRATKI